MLDLQPSPTGFRTGSPCWVDLLVRDVPAAQRFYASLFGWLWRPGDPYTGGYTLALLDGRPVAGVSRKPDHVPVPSQWTTYLRVDDIKAGAHSVAAHGGRVLGVPARLGRLAQTLIVQEPHGAYIGLWQPGDLEGAGVLDAPGTLTWNEAYAHDFEGTRAFYAGAFGHRFTEHTDGDEARWASAHTGDGNPALGLAELGWECPLDVQPYWLASFATTSLRSMVAKALDLGATLVHEPFEGPYGSGATLRGPDGEVFGLLDPDLD